jgi:hypothetical protein
MGSSRVLIQKKYPWPYSTSGDGFFRWIFLAMHRGCGIMGWFAE